MAPFSSLRLVARAGPWPVPEPLVVAHRSGTRLAREMRDAWVYKQKQGRNQLSVGMVFTTLARITATRGLQLRKGKEPDEAVV